MRQAAVTPFLRMAAWVVLVLAGWAAADLYLRVDLPLAGRLINIAFQAIVGPLAWLGADDQWRLYVAGAVIFWLAIVAGVRPGALPWLRPVGSALLALALVTVLGISVLMERALAGGLFVALLLSSRQPGSLPSAAPGPSARSRQGVAARLMIVTAGLVSAYYLFSLVLSWPEGYLLLEKAAALGRTLGLSLGFLYFAAVSIFCVVLAVLAYRRGARPGGRDGLALVVGLVATLTLAGFLEGRRPELLGWIGPFEGAGLLVVLLCGSLLFRHCRSVLQPAMRLTVPSSWPPGLVAPFLVALLLFGHSYACRILSCADLGSVAELTSIGQIPEVFRIELNRSGSTGFLSVRPRRSLASVQLQPQLGEIQWSTGPGNEAEFEVADVPEDLSYSSSRDRFFAMYSARDPSTFEGRETAVPIRSILGEFSGDGLQQTQATPFPDLCWASCIEWSEIHQKLYIGCEIPRGLHRWDPETGVFETAPEGHRLGDVESIALDPEPARDRLFSTSLWRSPMLSELRASDLSVQRQKWLGRANYVVAYDPGTDRLFVSSFFGSRVRILDGTSLEQLGLIRTGFGTRAIAIDKSRGMVLISSVYDGVLRVADTATGRVLRSLEVGGHVKDIAIDEATGFAYFWSQCALMRLDRESIVREGQPRAGRKPT